MLNRHTCPFWQAYVFGGAASFLTVLRTLARLPPVGVWVQFCVDHSQALICALNLWMLLALLTVLCRQLARQRGFASGPFRGFARLGGLVDSRCLLSLSGIGVPTRPTIRWTQQSMGPAPSRRRRQLGMPPCSHGSLGLWGRLAVSLLALLHLPTPAAAPPPDLTGEPPDPDWMQAYYRCRGPLGPPLRASTATACPCTRCGPSCADLFCAGAPCGPFLPARSPGGSRAATMPGGASG